MTPLEEAERFLRKAAEDEVILKKLVGDFEVSDAIWGFHAQQAVEKLLKAVLMRESVLFPKTHDITALLELLPNASADLPFAAEALEELAPYAVLLRYDEVIEEAPDRREVLTLINRMRSWAEDRVRSEAS